MLNNFVDGACANAILFKALALLLLMLLDLSDQNLFRFFQEK